MMNGQEKSTSQLPRRCTVLCEYLRGAVATGSTDFSEGQLPRYWESKVPFGMSFCCPWPASVTHPVPPTQCRPPSAALNKHGHVTPWALPPSR